MKKKKKIPFMASKALMRSLFQHSTTQDCWRTHLEEDDEGVRLREAEQDEGEEGGDAAVQDGRAHAHQAGRGAGAASAFIGGETKKLMEIKKIMMVWKHSLDTLWFF